MPLRLLQIIARVFKTPPETVTAESGPHTIAAWDSAGHLNLILELEREFSVRFDDDEVVELVSVQAIATALEKHGAQL